MLTQQKKLMISRGKKTVVENCHWIHKIFYFFHSHWYSQVVASYLPGIDILSFNSVFYWRVVLHSLISGEKVEKSLAVCFSCRNAMLWKVDMLVLNESVVLDSVRDKSWQIAGMDPFRNIFMIFEASILRTETNFDCV